MSRLSRASFYAKRCVRLPAYQNGYSHFTNFQQCSASLTHLFAEIQSIIYCPSAQNLQNRRERPGPIPHKTFQFNFLEICKWGPAHYHFFKFLVRKKTSFTNYWRACSPRSVHSISLVRDKSGRFSLIIKLNSFGYGVRFDMEVLFPSFRKSRKCVLWNRVESGKCSLE